MSTNTSTTKPLHCGELARKAGVSPDTIRYCERRRLLPLAARSAAGYQLFPPEAQDRVRVIRGALSIGFSVRELAAIFREREQGGALASNGHCRCFCGWRLRGKKDWKSMLYEIEHW